MRLFQVDAFASRPFTGNPAAVVPLDAWLPDATLQVIALENNLSETAYLVGGDGDYALRWFTPAAEVDLCGHATLAAAMTVFERLEPGCTRVRFTSMSGPLEVHREGDWLALDFPARPPREPAPREAVERALDAPVLEAWNAGVQWMAVLPDQEAVAALRPNFRAMLELPCEGVIATAPGREHDFVSRCFFPYHGIDEDPVCGSAHTTMTPYWAQRLGRDALRARQISARGGELRCELRGERVRIAGQACFYLEGEIDPAALIDSGSAERQSQQEARA